MRIGNYSAYDFLYAYMRIDFALINLVSKNTTLYCVKMCTTLFLKKKKS